MNYFIESASNDICFCTGDCANLKCSRNLNGKNMESLRNSDEYFLYSCSQFENDCEEYKPCNFVYELVDNDNNTVGYFSNYLSAYYSKIEIDLICGKSKVVPHILESKERCKFVRIVKDSKGAIIKAEVTNEESDDTIDIDDWSDYVGH